MLSGGSGAHYHPITGSAADALEGDIAPVSTHTYPIQQPPSHPDSAMSAPHDKFEVLDDGVVRHRTNWKRWAVGIATAVAVLGLALGLGLGLGLHNNDNNNAPPSTVTAVPPFNGSVPTINMNTAWQIMLIETVTLDTQATESTDSTSSVQLVTPNQSTDPNVTLIDIDMFLHQNLSVVQDLRTKGMHVICYFSSGSYEPGRPDSWKFTSSDKGNELDGWPGEYWLDLNSDNVRSIMTSRIEIAAKMNCSGIDPDNIDGYVRHQISYCIDVGMEQKLI